MDEIGLYDKCLQDREWVGWRFNAIIAANLLDLGEPVLDVHEYGKQPGVDYWDTWTAQRAHELAGGALLRPLDNEPELDS